MAEAKKLSGAEKAAQQEQMLEEYAAKQEAESRRLICGFLGFLLLCVFVVVSGWDGMQRSSWYRAAMCAGGEAAPVPVRTAAAPVPLPEAAAAGTAPAPQPRPAECDSGGKYLLYTVNEGEGFNLQRDVYGRVTELARQLQAAEGAAQWTLVLPRWRTPHWRTPHWRDSTDSSAGGRRGGGLAWSAFFEVGAIRYIRISAVDSLILLCC